MNEQALENLEVLDQMTEAEPEGAAILQTIEQEQQQTQQADAAELAAQQCAAMAVGMVEDFLKMRWSFLQIDDGAKEQVTEKAVPVFRKYGGDLPNWLKPYREEIALGMVLAAAGVGVYTQVQQHNLQGQAREKENESAASEPEYPAS